MNSITLVTLRRRGWERPALVIPGNSLKLFTHVRLVFRDLSIVVTELFIKLGFIDDRGNEAGAIVWI